MCLGLPQWRATRTQIEEPARHRKSGEQQSRLPQPRLTSTLAADSRVATALLVRFAHAWPGFAVILRGWATAQHSDTQHDLHACISIVPNRTASPVRFCPAQPCPAQPSPERAEERTDKGGNKICTTESRPAFDLSRLDARWGF